MTQRQKDKQSFILHLDMLDVLDVLSDEQIAELFKAIRAYHLGQEVELSPMVKVAFSSFKSAFERNAEKWERTKRQRANAGQKGGKKTQENKQLLSKSSKSKQSEANQAVSVSVSESVSGSVSDPFIPYQEENGNNQVLDTLTGEVIQFPGNGTEDF